MSVTYTPKAIWHEQITIIDVVDQVKGSVVGAANTPHQQLADSAAYLMARVVALENGEVLPPTDNTDYGAWQVTNSASLTVGTTETVVAKNTAYLSKPLTWTAALYNVNASGVQSDKKVIKADTAATSNAAGAISVSLGVIPTLAKTSTTVKQEVVFEINWGGTKNTLGKYAKVSNAIFAVADKQPAAPKPTEGFTFTVSSTGVVGDPAAVATVSGILLNNALDGSKGNITQLINYNYANVNESNNQIIQVKGITLVDGQWTATFGTALKDNHLTNAGTQANINKISYVFSIDGQSPFERVGVHY